MVIEIDILGLIPDSVKTLIRDTLVDFVTDQAKKYASDELANKIKKLRSDGAFNKQFEQGLQVAVQRFIDEYELQDEDLVSAIAADPAFFENEEIQEALMAVLKNPSGYLGEERETLRQSFDTVFPSRKNRERVDRAITYLLRCLAEELWHLPELQPIYSLQFQRITAEATRQQVELQKAQLQALTELNAGIRDALVQLTDAIAEQKLLPSGEDNKPVSHPKVMHNLPQPDYGRFIGREKEMAEVISILRPYPYSQLPLVTIDGIGGVGKSTLALEVAHRYLRNYERIPEEERFDALIWVTAKQTVLTADGIVGRSQVLRTLDDIYYAIAVTLDRQDISRARIKEQAEIVCNALSQQRTLLIVDNLETVDDETVRTFLHELPAPTKAIVTTRHRIDIAYPVRLEGMPKEDAIRLIEQECQEKNVKLPKVKINQLFERTGGIPLALVWSIAQMGYGYDADNVITRLGSPSNDIAKFSFEGTIDLIKQEPAYKLLMSLALFALSASRDALGFVAGYMDDVKSRDDGLVTLEKLSLVNRFSDRFSMLPITKAFVSGELAQKEQLRSDLSTRWKKWLVQYAQENGGESWDWRSYHKLNIEIDNILSLIDQGLENEWPEALLALRNITYYMKISGRWTENNKHSHIGVRLAEKLNDDWALGLLAVQSVGWTLGQLGELEQAIRYAQKGLRAYERLDYSRGIALSNRILGQIRRKEGKYGEAKKHYTIALAIAEKENTIGVKGNLIGELGKLARDQGEREKAYKLLIEATNLLADREKDKPIHASLLGHLANMYFEDSNLEAAKSAAEECLQIFDEDISGITEIVLTLAKIYYVEKDYEQADRMTNRALILFEQLGMQENLEETHKLKGLLLEAR